MKVVGQTTFEAAAFDSSRANLHTRPSARTESVIVFVHGLLASGYGTWGNVPPTLFAGNQAQPIDVCVFQYPTWFRKTPRDRPSLPAVLDQLNAAVQDLSGDYASRYWAVAVDIDQSSRWTVVQSDSGRWSQVRRGGAGTSRRCRRTPAALGCGIPVGGADTG